MTPCLCQCMEKLFYHTFCLLNFHPEEVAGNFLFLNNNLNQIIKFIFCKISLDTHLNMCKILTITYIRINFSNKNILEKMFNLS